ncbi:protein-L-isoaspartate O-methyltransferase [Streptomyces sp. CBMA152]|uniref:protein-L-isoaspartate O-methyltransferase family protein n=1 Tax=Streptomyces sp. CBMA152 TaxID=1896312 RepID=UPI001660E938|nr:methyltransferase domain-containing protein [Streptomyces sp. CBMA152]MBD0742228.1 hypothetical protein [Streptomyces sp. CBMA152]
MDYRTVCRRALEAKACLHAPWLRAAFDAVDRELFVPARAWVPERDERGRWRFLDREADEDAWRRAVWDSHQSVITQLDDGRTAPEGPADGEFTSSVSALDIVCTKLEQLGLDAGHRVLDVGYASGYHTALLCERVGSERTVGIEVDRHLAEWGASNLKGAGYTPSLVCGDGMAGVAQHAPFDRIISTAAVRTVPSAWVGQCAHDAVIVTPFGTTYANSGLLRLTVRGDRAHGHFAGSAAYMWIRGERPARALNVPDQCATRSSPLDPAEVLEAGWEQDFVIGLHTADVSFSHRGDRVDRKVQFVDQAGTSATIVRYRDWWEADAVKAWGPRDLWAEVVRAFTWYAQQGRPPVTEFGVTVDPSGQHAWYGEPDHVLNPRTVPLA